MLATSFHYGYRTLSARARWRRAISSNDTVGPGGVAMAWMELVVLQGKKSPWGSGYRKQDGEDQKVPTAIIMVSG